MKVWKRNDIHSTGQLGLPTTRLLNSKSLTRKNRRASAPARWQRRRMRRSYSSTWRWIWLGLWLYALGHAHVCTLGRLWHGFLRVEERRLRGRDHTSLSSTNYISLFIKHHFLPQTIFQFQQIVVFIHTKTSLHNEQTKFLTSNHPSSYLFREKGNLFGEKAG